MDDISIPKNPRHPQRGFSFLAIEFFDELVYGAREAAWPLIRSELGLSYVQVGLLLSLPDLVSTILEPLIGVWADLGARRKLILGGGIAFALAVVLTSVSENFAGLLVAFAMLSPASGAFVGLSQASLMDADPKRREQNMARWTLAGSLGVLAGPLALSVSQIAGTGWRSLFLLFSGLAAILIWATWRIPDHTGTSRQASRPENFWIGFRSALETLRQWRVLKWLILLEFSDLMLDVLYGYLALYFVDVVGVTPLQASLAVAVWTGFGLLGDLALIPLLERVAGLSYLRYSALIELLLYPAFLLVPGLFLKLILLGFLGFFNAGWYSVLKAQLYAAMPGQSGRVMTVDNLFGLIGGLVPLGLGFVAQRYNLEATMWLLALGPIVLSVALFFRRG